MKLGVNEGVPGISMRATHFNKGNIHPVTREADMEVPFLLKEMLS